jgi:prepilin-type N-terminal cleavage/methylation domain-containing protein
MTREAGFTLVEIIVVIAMIGILAVTSVPLYRTYQQRAYGSEASIMMKKIMDGQIMYYLDKNRFYPAVGQAMVIPPADPPTALVSQNIQDVLNALKIPILVGHYLEYTIVNYGAYTSVTIRANFPLFKGGYNALYGEVRATGEVTIFPVNI